MNPDSMEAPSPINSLHRRYLLFLVAAITLLFLWMISDFVMTLFLAAVFSAMSQPLFRFSTRLTRGSESWAAVVTLLILFFGVALPLFGFLILVANQAVEISQLARPWVEGQISDPGALTDRLEAIPYIGAFIPDHEIMMAKFSELASSTGSLLADSVVGLTRGTINFFLQLFVLLYAMYFFLKDGDEILDRILFYSPLPRESEAVLVGKMVSVTRAVLKGSLVVGVVQGGLAGLAFLVVGIPGWAFWMTIMMLLSVIPAIGSPIVWIPVSIILFVQGSFWTALLFTVWCAAVVGSVDNFLRPILIGRDTKMPDLLVLIGTIGGIVLFGVLGFIIGPIVASLFLAIWFLYGETFSRELADS
ncbi:MAG: AI-2E family transporter [Rhodothermales bacterium]